MIMRQENKEKRKERINYLEAPHCLSARIYCQWPCSRDALERMSLFFENKAFRLILKLLSDRGRSLMSTVVHQRIKEKLKPHLKRNIQHQRVSSYEVDQPTTYCCGGGSTGGRPREAGVVGQKPKSCRQR